MRDPKLPQDDYNKRLHIYAETPGLQLPATFPSSEKELNTPEASQEISSASRVQTNPYERIPADNFEEEETAESAPTPSNENNATSRIPPILTAANSLSISSSASYKEDTRAVKPRDPIYAELSHPICEDDQVERTGEKGNLSASAHPILQATSSTAASRSAAPQRLKGTAESTATGDSRNQSRKNVTSLSKESQLLESSREKFGNTKTMRTRMDACHEIAATPRTKFPSADDKDGGGVLLISKTDRNPDFASGSAPQSGEKGGISLKYVKPLEETLTAEPDGELVEEGRVAMPVDHDLDAGTAILKKKRRFRRNMLLIISFLLILLIVVAAVIIALVVVTKG